MKTTNKELLKKAQREGKFVMSVDTDFLGYDGITYDAKTTLVIEEDGTYYIDEYEYWNPNIEEWVNSQERDWDKISIEKTFDIKL